MPEHHVARPETLHLMKHAQLTWAARAGLAPNSQGYCGQVQENLFGPLSPETAVELSAGGGGELLEKRGRCKAQALHSSVILACNFFDYWRLRDLRPLAAVFDTDPLSGLAFEQRFPTGLRGTPPNLDVVLYEERGGGLAIESKFTEPFVSKTKVALKAKYFENGGMWRQAGLRECQALADELRDNPAVFEFLDAPQLLKHILGLAAAGSWRLCCLWYQPAGFMGEQHEIELIRFTERIGGDAIRFSSMPYQHAFSRLREILGSEHAEDQTYLEDRYFPQLTAKT